MRTVGDEFAQNQRSFRADSALVLRQTCNSSFDCVELWLRGRMECLGYGKRRHYTMATNSNRKTRKTNNIHQLIRCHGCYGDSQAQQHSIVPQHITRYETPNSLYEWKLINKLPLFVYMLLFAGLAWHGTAHNKNFISVRFHSRVFLLFRLVLYFPKNEWKSIQNLSLIQFYIVCKGRRMEENGGHCFVFISIRVFPPFIPIAVESNPQNFCWRWKIAFYRKTSHISFYSILSLSCVVEGRPFTWMWTYAAHTLSLMNCFACDAGSHWLKYQKQDIGCFGLKQCLDSTHLPIPGLIPQPGQTTIP